MTKISKFILRIAGWKTVITLPEPPKSVICVAPHTSNWDYILGQLFYWSHRRDASFLIKSSWFVFPFGLIFRKLGGVPVNRERGLSVIEQMVREFNSREHFHLAVTPEGTRKRVKKWKMGFYQIAVEAQVAIQLAYIDYGKKEIGIKKILVPSGNEASDLQEIYSCFENVTACHPENFCLPKK